VTDNKVTNMTYNETNSSKVSNFSYPFEAYNFTNNTWAKKREDVIYRSIDDLKIKDGDDPFTIFP